MRYFCAQSPTSLQQVHLIDLKNSTIQTNRMYFSKSALYRCWSLELMLVQTLPGGRRKEKHGGKKAPICVSIQTEWPLHLEHTECISRFMTAECVCVCVCGASLRVCVCLHVCVTAELFIYAEVTPPQTATRSTLPPSFPLPLHFLILLFLFNFPPSLAHTRPSIV